MNKLQTPIKSYNVKVVGKPHVPSKQTNKDDKNRGKK